MNALPQAAALAGLDLAAVGAHNLRRAMGQAMRRLNLKDQELYLARLEADPLERRLLAGEAVVQETWFFRDPEAFAALTRLAPTLSRPVRALCVPCATGEEPASMALAFMKAGLEPEHFFIDAADASQSALDKARTGRFGPSSFRSGMQAEEPLLRQDGEDAILAPRVLARIRFICADVLDDSFLADENPYQVVFCRHLLIYFSPRARARLAGTLARLLGEDGVLFTTPAEAGAFMSLGLAPHPRTSLRPSAPECPPAPEAPYRQSSRPEAFPKRGREEAPSPGAPSARQAQTLADAGRLDEALACIDQAVALDGPSARLFHLKGAVLLALGRDDDAEETLKRAVYLDPGHLESLTHLELLSRAKGRADEAALLAERVRRAGEASS